MPKVDELAITNFGAKPSEPLNSELGTDTRPVSSVSPENKFLLLAAKISTFTSPRALRLSKLLRKISVFSTPL